MKEYAVITVLNNLSETSMPWNEFVLYRYKHNQELKQYVIVCATKKDSDNVPNDLDVTFTGFQAKKIRQVMKRILSECKAQHMDYVLHLHQIKSAAFFNLSTLFCGYAKKTLFTVHNQFMAYNIQNKLASVFNSLCAKRVNNVSFASYTAYPEIVKKIKKDRMSYIDNGVDIERIDGILSSHIRQKGSVKRFVYAARMIPVKNHSFLIDVFHEIQDDYELILIGAEDAAGAVRKRVNEYGMSDRVVMKGLIPRNELFSELSDCDVYVSPSAVEGLPVSVLEAMAVGLPVVVSDIEPHKEILDFCTDIDSLPLDKSVWKDSITRIINADDSQLLQVGQKCRDTVVSEFSLQKMHQKYYKEYEALLK